MASSRSEAAEGAQGGAWSLEEELHGRLSGLFSALSDRVTELGFDKTVRTRSLLRRILAVST